MREEPYEMTDHFPAAQVCLEERGGEVGERGEEEGGRQGSG